MSGVYDGSTDPTTKNFTARGLATDQSYGFKVVPVNVVGDGIPTLASTIVVARAGASAPHTTVSGSALTQGVAGVIYERQAIFVEGNGALSGQFRLRIGVTGESSGLIDFNVGEAAMAAALEGLFYYDTDRITHLQGITYSTVDDEADSTFTTKKTVGALQVTRTDTPNAGKTGYRWIVTFSAASDHGDVPLVQLADAGNLDDGGGTSSVTSEEFVEGKQNRFTIEPKKASGELVKDVDAANGFAGEDVFFTELWTTAPSVTNGSHAWSSDGGVAQYNAVIYEIQEIRTTVTSGFLAGTFKVGFDTTARLDGAAEVTAVPVAHDADALHMKQALELLPNVGFVDVSKTISGADATATWTVTFKSLLGDLPQMTTSTEAWSSGVGGASNVVTVQHGMTEIQTVTTAAEDAFEFERQTITTSADASQAITGTFTLTYNNAATGNLEKDASAAAVEAALEALPDIADVDVSRVAAPGGATVTDDYVWTVTFIDPVGDALALVATPTLGGTGAAVSVYEAKKGYAPLGGTYILSYMGETTDNIAFAASAKEVKTRLEALATIGTVDVQREARGNGHRWTVTFLSNLGNLPMIGAAKVAEETQVVTIRGGDPTPVGGTFTLSFAGSTTEPIRYDASASTVKANLEALPSVGTVTVYRTGPVGNGQYEWTVIFRTERGNLAMMVPNGAGLTGTLPTGFNMIEVTELQTGDAASLTGVIPQLSVREKLPGRPSYTGQYNPVEVGTYTLAVRKLAQGGLRGDYYDNQYFMHNPVITRVDPMLDFNWGLGLLTDYAKDYVSVRWAGKLRAPTTETYTLFVRADDAVKVWVDHVVRVDTWSGATALDAVSEHKFTMKLTQGQYHDIRVDYKETQGPAMVKLQWQSLTQKKQTVPSANLFHADFVAGMPTAIAVRPGAADFPYTEATGAGLVAGVAGTPTSFVIQAKDASGNNKTSTAGVTGLDVFDVLVSGAGSTGATMQKLTITPEYIGAGRYMCRYTPTVSGTYTVDVKMGGMDIYCGKGLHGKCSPFTVPVVSGDASHETSSAHGQGLTDSVVGVVATFSIQARDTYGNLREVGGDVFDVTLTHSNNGAGNSDVGVQSDVQHKGIVEDKGDGTYVVTYTLTLEGYYDVEVRLGGQLILTSPIKPGNVETAAGSPQVSPFGDYTVPVVRAVHWEFYAPTSIATGAGLSDAVDNIQTSFTINAKDAFGNDRIGHRTPAGLGSGDGDDDWFLVEIQHTASDYKVTTSSAIQKIDTTKSGSDTPTGTFTVTYDGRTTAALPYDIDAASLEAVIETLHSPMRTVRVHRAIASGSYDWDVTFTSDLDKWHPSKFTVDGTGTLTGATVAVVTEASVSFYPVRYTVWQKGTYTISVTGPGGVHVRDSPFSMLVDDGAVEPSSSTVSGQGLVDGVVGDAFEFTLQSVDTRVPEVQVVQTAAVAVPEVDAVQTVACSKMTGDFTLTFRESTTATIAFGADKATIESALRALPDLGTVEVTMDPAQAVACAAAAAPFSVAFKGVRVPMPELTANSRGDVTVATTTVGETASRYEVQLITCTATAGSFALTVVPLLLVLLATSAWLIVLFAAAAAREGRCLLPHQLCFLLLLLRVQPLCHGGRGAAEAEQAQAANYK